MKKQAVILVSLLCAAVLFLCLVLGPFGGYTRAGLEQKAIAELPRGSTIDEVRSWIIKHGTFYLTDFQRPEALADQYGSTEVVTECYVPTHQLSLIIRASFRGRSTLTSSSTLIAYFFFDNSHLLVQVIVKSVVTAL